MLDSFDVPVAYVVAMLGAVTGALGFVTRQLLAAKQEQINDCKTQMAEQAENHRGVVAKMDAQNERATLVTEELRDVVRGIAEASNRRDVQQQELLTELRERRGPLLRMLEEYSREHRELWQEREARRSEGGGAQGTR